VVVFSRSRDAETTAVTGLLARAGVRAARVDADDLEAMDMLADAGTRTVRVRGRWLAPTVTWVRHFAPRAIPGQGPAAYDMFLRDSWRSMTAEVAAVSGARVGVPSLGLAGQQLLARRHQVAVPRTVITSDAAGAARSFQCPRLVIKAVHRHFVEAAPGRLSWIFPVIAERRELAGTSWPGPPVVVQEYIEHDAELRVYWVRGQLHCFQVTKSTPADPWTAPDRVIVSHVEPPAAVASAARRLAAAMEIPYGAFDFLLRGGTPYFLEVNVDGDWRWTEAKAGVAPVTLAVARLLCDLHREQLGMVRAERGPGAGSFSLLTFLSGAAAPPS
jgi:hypothetical protein